MGSVFDVLMHWLSIFADALSKHWTNDQLSGSLMIKTKKGVKRKADTTTPGALIHASSPYDPTFEVSASIKAQAKQLVADGRAVKKVRKDSFDDSKSYKQEGATAPLDYCREILKELFGKKHAVRCQGFELRVIRF